MNEPVKINGALGAGYGELLTDDALSFLGALAHRFAPRINASLQARVARRTALKEGATLDFLPETADIRSGDWTVGPLPADLLDRRVEITGPVDRKMVINALNSGANVFMADFEDSNAPTWANLVDGQINLRDAIAGTITYTAPHTGKRYALGETLATLMVRPRGLHLVEQHAHFNGQPIPASLFDFGLFFFHNAKALIAKGSGPYFYLPKLESHQEAGLWNDVFCYAQDALGIAQGTIKATVLIETLPAAFEMDEILFALKEHSAGLNCGRWDYIFSSIKTLRDDPNWIVPDRGQVGMTQHFMRSYTLKVIQTCHRREVHAMGGMAAQIPIKHDAALNDAALAKVRVDKTREAQDGHDGTWVAHPGLVALARDVFDAEMSGPNQISRKREDVNVTAADLLKPPTGTRTEDGLRINIRIGVQYLEAWLRGQGCVPLYFLMEDAATAEISRTQVWQWLHHGVSLTDGTSVTPERVRALIEQELASLRKTLGAERFDGGRFDDAAKLFTTLCIEDTLTEFLTLPAYELLLKGA